MRPLFFVALLFLTLRAEAGYSDSLDLRSNEEVLERFLEEARQSNGATVERIRRDSSDTVAIPHSRPKRGFAIALTVLLGPLGGHRLYLGTEPHVPVLYTVTLGGGFLLPLIDLVHLIVADDMESFLNDRKVFMWMGDEEKEEDEE